MPKGVQSGALVAAALLALLVPIHARRVEVRSCAELAAALNDTGVHHIDVLPIPREEGGYDCDADVLPPGGFLLTDRALLLEGRGPEKVYFNLHRVNRQLAVGRNGNLTQRNIWADNCLQAQSHPYQCFAYPVAASAWIEAIDLEMSDASCVNVNQSQAIQAFAYAVKQFRVFRYKIDAGFEDDRTLLFRETEWYRAPPYGAHARFQNVAFTCTGNVTFPLPPNWKPDTVYSAEFMAVLSLGSLALLLMAAGLCWCLRRSAKESQPPDYQVAESQGFALEAPLGSGHYGRVYKARNKATGEPVAVKVIDLLPSQQRQTAAALRECQLMSRIQHDCIVRVFSFYKAQVQKQRHTVERSPGGYIELDGNGAPADPKPGSGDSAPAGSSGTPSFDLDTVPQVGSMFGSGKSSILLVQVQLVMQYCDMGSLEQAIRGGVFKDPETDKLRVRAVVATALEIAQGLQYLHHQERRMVHRDLSASNVLLTTAAGDERGFRALLSDFGLSLALSGEATHKTSEVKGTISYMSPEVFLQDHVSPGLDIYSLGVLIHMMCTGEDPYLDQTPAQIILHKIRGGEHPEESQLPAIDGIPRALQQLVWDCTAHSRGDRPSADAVVRRLEALLAGL